MKLLLFFLCIINFAFAQNQATVLSTSGLTLDHAQDIRLQDLSLIISPELISVDYILQNVSEKDFTTTVSFVTPPITSGKTGNKKDFSDFSLFVEGDRINYKTAILATRFDGKDIRESLKKLKLPTDGFRSWNNLTRQQQKEARKKGLYLNKKPQYSFQKVYHWEQDFPKEKLIRISHSYDPKVSAVELNRVDHEQLWKGRLKVEAHAQKEEVSFIGYLLSKGPAWKRGVEQFNLTITGGAVIMAEVDGKIYGDLGVLKVEQKKFEPTGDLMIEFIGTTNQKAEGVSLKLPLTEAAPCMDEPNGKSLKTFRKDEEVIISKRQDFWLWVEAGKCWIHQSSIRE